MCPSAQCSRAPPPGVSKVSKALSPCLRPTSVSLPRSVTGTASQLPRLTQAPGPAGLHGALGSPSGGCLRGGLGAACAPVLRWGAGEPALGYRAAPTPLPASQGVEGRGPGCPGRRVLRCASWVCPQRCPVGRTGGLQRTGRCLCFAQGRACCQGGPAPLQLASHRLAGVESRPGPRPTVWAWVHPVVSKHTF